MTLVQYFAVGVSVQAQTPKYHSELYTVEDGLSHSTVLGIGKDSCGFIWVSTANGINRFDGAQFKNYKIDFKYYMGFVGSDVKGQLWAGFPQVTSLQYDFELDTFSFPYAHICERGFPFRQRNGDLWMFVGDTLYNMEERSDGSTSVRLATSTVKEIGWVYWMFDLLEGGPYIHNPDGFFRAEENESGIFLSEYTIEADGRRIHPPWLTNVIPCGDSVWFLSGDQLIRASLPASQDEKVFRGEYLLMDDPRIKLSKEDKLFAISWDSSEFLYFRTLNGVYSLSANTGKVEWIYREEYPILDEGEGRFQAAMFYDPDGILWIGTDKGLVKIIIKPKDFQVISPNFQLQNPLLYPKLNSVLVDRNDQLWLGGWEGLFRSRPEGDGSYRRFEQFQHAPSDAASIAGNGISSLFEDSGGSIYLSAGQTLHESHLQVITKTTADRPAFHSIGTGFTYQIREDHQGLILFSQAEDVSLAFDPIKDTLYRFYLDKDMSFYTEGMLAYKNDRQCYFLTEKGLFQISGQVQFAWRNGTNYAYPEKVTLLLDSLVNNFTLPDSANNYGLRFIVTRPGEDEEFWIYAGNSIRHYARTRQNGNSKLLDQDPGSLQLRGLYNAGNGLSDGRVYEMIEDDRNRIWCSTANGLTCIDPKNDRIYRYYSEDGLPTSKFNNGCFRDRHGALYFCTNNGLTWFYPDSIIPEEKPKVYLTELRLFNKAFRYGPDSPLEKQLMFTDGIQLPYDENFISIEFTALDFTGSKRLKYRYMMEGLGQDWVDAGSRRMADYPGLKPGRYTFRVIASNSNGVWNTAGASLDIHITPPFWFRWWSFVIEGLLIIIILVIMIRLRERNLRTRAISLEKKVVAQTRQIISQRKEVDDMKTRFYTNITHEFRTPLTLILGPVDDSLKKAGSHINFEREIVEMMRRNAQRLQRLINQLLDISKLESGAMKLRLSACDLTVLARTISGSFLSLAESRGIIFETDLQEIHTATNSDVDKVEKILINLLSNAFKYTAEGGKVIFRLKYIVASKTDHPQSVEYTVEDSGRGIAREHLPKIFDRFYHASVKVSGEDESMGIGLALTRELVELLGGQISVESEVGKGSLFKVSLPVSLPISLPISEMSDSGKIQAQVPPGDISRKTGYYTEEVLEGQHKSEPESRNKNSYEVLVVEDNSDLRTYIIQQLKHEFRIREANDGREGVDKAVKFIPDLIISDLMMPVMDGVEMCTQLKNDARTSHIPIIMLTARADKSSKIEGLETGADDYIIKPFDADELRIRAKNLVAQREKLREKLRLDLITMAPNTSSLSPQDELLLQILRIMRENLADPEFRTDRLMDELHISKAQLYRKTEALTGIAPAELLRMIRLKTAATLFQSGHKNVAQVMYMVGFNHQSNFARIFRKQFGLNPAAYIKSVEPEGTA